MHWNLAYILPRMNMRKPLRAENESSGVAERFHNCQTYQLSQVLSDVGMGWVDKHLYANTIINEPFYAVLI